MNLSLFMCGLRGYTRAKLLYWRCSLQPSKAVCPVCCFDITCCFLFWFTCCHSWYLRTFSTHHTVCLVLPLLSLCFMVDLSSLTCVLHVPDSLIGSLISFSPAVQWFLAHAFAFLSSSYYFTLCIFMPCILLNDVHITHSTYLYHRCDTMIQIDKQTFKLLYILSKMLTLVQSHLEKGVKLRLIN